MPKFIQWLYPQRIWAFSTKSNTVHLTFDDGPIPEVTPWVLSELKKYNAKATFFCIGENIEKHPQIFKQIIDDGHAVGNHTYNHINGWEIETSEYIKNVLKAQDVINSEFRILNSELLFRPPYGKMTSKQAKILQQKGFKILMWDVLSYDYDASISKKKCLQNIQKNIDSGSIVVLHDSLKAENNIRYVLPKVLTYLSLRQFNISKINNISLH